MGPCGGALQCSFQAYAFVHLLYTPKQGIADLSTENKNESLLHYIKQSPLENIPHACRVTMGTITSKHDSIECKACTRPARSGPGVLVTKGTMLWPLIMGVLDRCGQQKQFEGLMARRKMALSQI